MDASKDNANPAILNPSDLPTRRHDLLNAQKSSTSLFDGLIPSYPYYSSIQAAAAASAAAAGPLSPPESPTLSAASSNDLGVSSDEDGDAEGEEIDEQEIYDLISTISDPEHPLSLGSLAVVNLPDIKIFPPSTPKSRISTVRVLVTPTITHCSLATVIGLGVRVRLEQSLPPRFRIDVRIKEGTHASDEATNKQLGDKERVAAAMENGTLVGVIRKMLSTCE